MSDLGRTFGFMRWQAGYVRALRIIMKRIFACAGRYSADILAPHTAVGCRIRSIDKDGVEISGGEAQKIALARALYKDAPVVILDEPTAALDPIAEQEIYSGFRNLVGSKTAIFISHRLSSCRFCDEILVFHEGRLVQRGSHDALLAEDGGRYSMMWQAQAKYYEDSSFSFDTDYEVIS